jgi:hypothetical protein
MPLKSYFENEIQQRRALQAVGDDWFEARELDLYDEAHNAFDPSMTNELAFQHFNVIYEELASSRWNAFRPAGRNRCWPPKQIFETIKREFPEFSPRGQITLLNFHKTAAPIESRLAKMRGIKPNEGYPHMTVSKFLHFYNPALFPIYDEAVIWNKVFKRFDADFRSFCWSARIPYESAIKDTSAAFLRYYMLWASSLMSVAHPAFMSVFKDWLDHKPGTALPKRKFEVTTLYTRAFEYTVTGAAKL